MKTHYSIVDSLALNIEIFQHQEEDGKKLVR